MAIRFQSGCPFTILSLSPLPSTPLRYDTCGSTPISGPGELVFMRKYDTHHMSRPSAVGAS